MATLTINNAYCGEGFNILLKTLCGNTPVGYVATNSPSAGAYRFNSDGTKIFSIQSTVSTTDIIIQHNLSTPYDVTTISNSGVTLDISGKESLPTDLDFSSDGLKLFITGYNSDSIHEYHMVDAWDISTASFYQTKNISAISATNRICTFANSGSIVYLGTESGGDSNVYKCNLSTPYDISTLTYGGITFNFNAGDSRVWSFDISPDGKFALVCGTGEDAVAQFNLSTPFDITSASLHGMFTASSAPYSVEWKPDGSKFFVYKVNGEITCYTSQ